jgi:hypothetical protein
MSAGRKIALLLGIFTTIGCEIYTTVKIMGCLVDDKKHHWMEYGCLILIAYALHKIEMAFNGELKKTLTIEEN